MFLHDIRQRGETTVNRTAFFCNMTLRNLVDKYWRFGAACCLHLYGTIYRVSRL